MSKEKTIPQRKSMREDSIMKDDSMRFKYSELLSVKKELLLPPSYKRLLELQSLLDNTLNFKIFVRKQRGLFPEIKQSIETQGR